jgi:hypothetical protein
MAYENNQLIDELQGILLKLQIAFDVASNDETN